MFVTIAILALVVVVYTFVGHPAILFLISRMSPRHWKVGQDKPSVLIFVAARNEERDIRQKIENLLSLQYEGGLKFLIANDASTDNTARIVEEYVDDRLALASFEENIGKTAMQNELIPQSDADIVIFSDATSIWPEDCVRKIASHFSDPEVGCVAVDIEFVEVVDGSVQKGQGALWKYERYMREKGALAGTGIVASGTCYGIRRRLFQRLPNEIAEDLGTPLGIAKRGHRVVFERSAKIAEVSKNSHDEESAMRVRIALQNITALVYFRQLLLPRHGFVAFQFFGQKFLRAVCWIALLALFAASVGGREHPALEMAMWAQIAFYSAAFAGFLVARTGHNAGPLNLPYYFALLNFSYAVGLLRYLEGHRGATWQTNR